MQESSTATVCGAEQAVLGSLRVAKSLAQTCTVLAPVRNGYVPVSRVQLAAASAGQGVSCAATVPLTLGFCVWATLQFVTFGEAAGRPLTSTERLEIPPPTSWALAPRL